MIEARDHRLLLAVDDLSIRLETDAGTLRAVDGVTFSVAPGRTLGIVGESGAGKTMLALGLLGLIDSPGARVSGRALLGGRDLTALPASELRTLRGDRIAIAFQDPLAALHPLLAIGDQIVEAIRAHRPVGRGVARRRAIELLELVRMPEAGRRVDQYAHQLSGGMRQRAMLAIALANEPDLLIADEPTSALDVTVQASILDLIGQLQSELGMSVILISHDLGVVARLADDVAVMRAGRIVEQGPVERIFTNPREAYTRELLDAIPRLDVPPPPRPSRPAAIPLLEVEGLVRHFAIRSSLLRGRRRGAVRAVDGVSLTLARGETLGLVGESGCGKTTLCRSILRLLEPDAGSVRVNGRDIIGCSRRELRRMRAQMQMIFQDPYASLNPRRRVAQLVAEPLRVHRAASGPEAAVPVEEMLARVGLGSGYGGRYPHELSGGERQRVAIARALILHPSLVIADEPVSALDVSVQAGIVDLLGDLRDELGLAYVFVSHDLALVRRIADRIAVMHLGKIVELGPAEGVSAAPIHPYTRSLLAAVPPPRPSASARSGSGVTQGEPPSPADPPPGCRFHTRCPYATAICTQVEPPLVDHGGGHWAACHHPLGGDTVPASGRPR